MKKDLGGSVILHWLVKDIKKTIVPYVYPEIQEQIQKKVQESFKLREQSKQLLEIAKKGVEIAIEKDEATSESWMKEEMEKLGIEISFS